MKNKLPIIVAIVIGVVALLSIRSYVNKKEAEAEAKLKGERVVAARVDIAAGAEVTMEVIKAKEVPKQFIPPQAIQGAAEVKQILGRKTRVDIKAGQIILWSDLASEARGGLAGIIPAGEGAFTIAVAKGVKPGLIQPGDHVDVLGSFALPKGNQPAATVASWRQASDMVNVVLLQNVTVLAVGDVYSGTVRSSGATGNAELTLSLTLAEAQLLMFATAHGELGAVLRKEGANDVRPRGELPRITFEAIERVIGDLDGRRNLRLVEVQKAGRVETVPVVNP